MQQQHNFSLLYDQNYNQCMHNFQGNQYQLQNIHRLETINPNNVVPIEDLKSASLGLQQFYLLNHPEQSRSSTMLFQTPFNQLQDKNIPYQNSEKLELRMTESLPYFETNNLKKQDGVSDEQGTLGSDPSTNNIQISKQSNMTHYHNNHSVKSKEARNDCFLINLDEAQKSQVQIEQLFDFQKSKIKTPQQQISEQNYTESEEIDEDYINKENQRRKRGPKIRKANSKIFECDFCHIQVTRKDNLQKHIKNIHQQQKRFKCGICFRQFTEKGNLTVHYRLHMNIKPYKCEVCNIQISSKGNLKDHQKRHFKKKQIIILNHLQRFLMYYMPEEFLQKNLIKQSH
ncbi:zinc finger [Stylonychia lemnae]|uniref:Zinc finger n=1 Tax=Stylonychia lemnae TaxID=5949 RepID=A0A078AZE8_STYLE|nr:zinc finger [Stylonychia lemnae]|eukprot:CDW86188.1 zinc finger [Stylonychia lemnae]